MLYFTGSDHFNRFAAPKLLPSEDVPTSPLQIHALLCQEEGLFAQVVAHTTAQLPTCDCGCASLSDHGLGKATRVGANRINTQKSVVW
jgi:hypothetical protein